MASSGMGVWISIQSLSVIRLYHASSCEHLADVDTKDAVHKMLAGKYNTFPKRGKRFRICCDTFFLAAMLGTITTTTTITTITTTTTITTITTTTI